jgi:hypothetical protein
VRRRLPTLEIMVEPPAHSATRVARPFLLNAAVIVVVLGVLPVLWDAHPLWRVLGPLVAGVCAVRGAAEIGAI